MNNQRLQQILPSKYVRDNYGDKFPGDIVIWDKQTKKSRFFDNSQSDELDAYVERYKGERDLFMGIATQQSGLPETKRGSASTAVLLPCLFADIDFASEKSSDKNYPPDKETALKILDEFEFKPSLVQSSGGGLHAIFKLSEAIDCQTPSGLKRAKELAKAFQEKLSDHFRNHGFEIDNVSDVARLYRVPNTYNHKYGEPRKVEVLHYDPEATIELASVMAQEVSDHSTDELKPKRKFRPATHEYIQQDCPWYGHVTGEGAATCDEPNWHAAAGITACCKDGEQVFANYSVRHPKYDPKEARKKYKHASGAGPRTCEAIRSDLGNERFCDECPYYEQITSPVQLGYGYEPGKTGPIPLGYKRDGDFAFLDQKMDLIFPVSSSQLQSHHFLNGKDENIHWKAQFPPTGKAKTGPTAAYDAAAAGQALMKACIRKGPFDPELVRGRGVWTEDGNVIVNLGQPVPENSRHIYLCFTPMEIDVNATFDSQRLLRLINKLPWSDPNYAIFNLGWLAVAPICGALSRRPSLYLVGPPNSGETTLHDLGSNILRPLGLSADGQSTEAGIRQKLGADARPVLQDEFEPGSNNQQMDKILKLARSSYSAETPVLRGTPEGKSVEFLIRGIFFWSSINRIQMTPQDQSRVITLDLIPHTSDPLIGKEIERESAYFSKVGPQWCGYMATHAGKVLASIEVFSEALSHLESRHRQNMATLLSGAFVALNARVVASQEAEEWAAEYAVTIAGFGEAHERDDSSECLDHLFGHVVRSSDGQEFSLGHWTGAELKAMRDGRRDNAIRESHAILARYGLRFYQSEDENGLLIKNGSPQIDKIFQGTKWTDGAWKTAIKRIPGAFSLNAPQRFPGSPGKHRSVGLPLSLIPDPVTDPASNEEY